MSANADDTRRAESPSAPRPAARQQPIRVAILFEFGTLLGGERSMLATLDAIAVGQAFQPAEVAEMRPAHRADKDVCPTGLERIGDPSAAGALQTLPATRTLRASGSLRPEFEFTAFAPSHGPLAAALRERGIAHVPFDVRDAAGNRRPREEVRAELIGHVERISPHVLHANSLAMGRLTGSIAGEVNCAGVAHLRDISRQSAAAIRDFGRNDLALAVSRATKDFHVAQGLPSERVRVLHNGVDCETFQPRPRTGALRRELGLSDDAFLVLNIGQIGLRKGQDVLAAAAVGASSAMTPDRTSERDPDAPSVRVTGSLAPTWRSPANLHYLFVGERYSMKAESVEFERSIRRTFESADLADRLHRLGYRDDVSFLMNEADLLVHAAHQEPLGRVLLEAAASGLPIIATDVGGTREILDEETARLIPPADPAAMAHAILELHAAPDHRARLATAARQRILDHFTIERAAAAMAAVWRERGDVRSTA